MITRRSLIKAGLISAGMVSSAGVVSGDTPADPPLISGATALVGAQTLAGVKILTLDGPLSGVSVAGGTTTPSAYNLSATGVLSVASDGSMVGEDGNTITYTSDQGTGTITLSVDDTQTFNWTVTDYTEMVAAYVVAINDSFLTSGAGQIILKDGDYGTSGTFYKNRTFVNPLILRSENQYGARFTNLTDLNNADNFIFDGIYFAEQINLRFAAENIIIRDTEHHFLDVLTDANAYDASPGGPQYQAIWGSGTCRDITIQRAKIHGWGEGITCGALIGPITIDGCEISNIFEDSIKLGGGFPVTITDCVIEQSLASSTSFGSPHADAIQFLGNSTKDWENVLIARNIFYSKYPNRFNQFLFVAGMGSGFYYSGIQVLGNVFVSPGGPSTGIRIGSPKVAIVRGNTVVSHLGGTAQGPAILLGETETSGTHTVENNVTDGIDISGPQTNVTNNVLLGVGGANVAYNAAFTGSTFAPASRADVLSEFGMRPSGPLDGGGGSDNVGTIGSGYVTFPTNSPGNDGKFNAI